MILKCDKCQSTNLVYRPGSFAGRDHAEIVVETCLDCHNIVLFWAEEFPDFLNANIRASLEQERAAIPF